MNNSKSVGASGCSIDASGSHPRSVVALSSYFTRMRPFPIPAKATSWSVSARPVSPRRNSPGTKPTGMPTDRPAFHGIPGHEVSGTVEALGAGVTDLQVGEDVYGLADFPRDGAAAEYIAIRAANLAPKPESIDYVQAAAVPLSALTAWQSLFDKGRLTAGQRVLIHGAAGGVGTYAVQLARWRGAQVIATASAANADFLRELGADKVIDYTTTRFEDEVQDADVVLDTIGGDTLERSWPIIRRNGVLVTLPAPPPVGKAEHFGVKSIFFIVEPNRVELIGNWTAD